MYYIKLIFTGATSSTVRSHPCVYLCVSVCCMSARSPAVCQTPNMCIYRFLWHSNYSTLWIPMYDDIYCQMVQRRAD